MMKAITNGRCILPDKNDAFEVVPSKVVLYDETGICAIQDADAFDAKTDGIAERLSSSAASSVSHCAISQSSVEIVSSRTSI